MKLTWFLVCMVLWSWNELQSDVLGIHVGNDGQKTLLLERLDDTLSAVRAKVEENGVNLHPDMGGQMTPELAKQFALSIEHVQGLVVKVRLKNKDKVGHYMVRFETPFSEPLGNRVVRAFPSERAIFMGVIMELWTKHLKKEDLIFIGPGASVETSLNVSEQLGFKQTGKVEVQVYFDLMLLDMPSDSSLEAFLERGIIEEDTLQTQLESNKLALEIKQEDVHAGNTMNEAAAEMLETFAGTNEKMGHSFPSCSSSQVNVITAAINNAIISIQSSLTELPGGVDYAAKFENDLRHYLGPDSSSKTDSEVASIFRRALDILETRVTVRCNGDLCQPFVFAYVYPSSLSLGIHVCDQFFRASPDPFVRDSQPGTLIHELVHFNAVGDADDIVYGSPAVETLAKTDPSKARNNADNYEAFTETYVLLVQAGIYRNPNGKYIAFDGNLNFCTYCDQRLPANITDADLYHLPSKFNGRGYNDQLCCSSNSETARIAEAATLGSGSIPLAAFINWVVPICTMSAGLLMLI